MAITKGRTTKTPVTDSIDKQIAQANADKKTAKATKATAKANKQKNKAEMQKSKGYSHGITLGFWRRTSGGTEQPPAKSGKARQTGKPAKSGRGKKK